MLMYLNGLRINELKHQRWVDLNKAEKLDNRLSYTFEDINKTSQNEISASFFKKKDIIAEKEIDSDYHTLTLEQLENRFNVSIKNGLDSRTAANLLTKNGKNLIKQEKKNVVLQILGYLVTGFCGILWIGALICFLAWKPIGDPPDATNLGLGILLIFVILFQAVFSAFQDWSSNKVMKSIKNMMPSSASVIRDGSEKKVAVEELVVGDLVILSYGAKVPADIRITESSDLKFDKSMLTGESEAIEGTVECTDERYVESKNIAFMTTLITQGQGKGVVVEVGDKTMMGKIAKLTSSTGQKQTSLQKEITRFVIIIVIMAVATVTIILIVWGTWLKSKYPDYINTSTMMVNVIGLLVAFIPTGLPVAVTLSLLLMARKMAKHRVLVKNLTTIETLSCVNVIASDKTGTLTQNKMFVASAAAGLQIFDIKTPEENKKNKPYKQLVATAFLCNNAKFIEDNPGENENIPISQRKAKGDATDIALLRFSTENIANPNNFENYSLLAEIPFNSKNKWMMKLVSTINFELHNETFGENFVENESLMLLKGAPDVLLRKCKFILEDDGSMSPLNDSTKLNIIRFQNDWCILGQRVLLLCKKKLSNEDATEISTRNASEVEKLVQQLDDFCLVGILGIIDPPREGIEDVVSQARGAGIRVFMVTGDYALTAAAIATEIGIFTSGNYDTSESLKEKNKKLKILDGENLTKEKNLLNSLLLTGTEIESLVDEDWRLISQYNEIVFARTTPEQKLKIVKEFQRDGFIVSVTGDGVNDAPALKSADIGIAMGGGSEVAMEAAQMVLLDNSFSSILIAIVNGRLVFENLRKVILYLLPAGSFAEIVPILINIFLGVPLPLSAFLMICICVLTDMAPALSMMLEKPEYDLLKKTPRSVKDHLVDYRLIVQAYLFIGMMEAFFSHCLFFWYLQWYGGFKPSDVLLAFDRWDEKFKGFNKDQLHDFVYTGQTVTFVALVIMQIFGNIFATRTKYCSIVKKLPFLKKSRNLWLFAAQFVSLSLMIIIVFVPFINDIFKTRQIPAEFYFIPVGFAFLILGADELRKLLVRNKVLCFPRLAW